MSNAANKTNGRQDSDGVLWVAAPGTLHRLGNVLRPVAAHLIGGGRPLVLVCPETAATDAVPEQGPQLAQYRPQWLDWLTGLQAPALAEQVRRHRIGVVHALEERAAPLATRLARMLEARTVVSYYDQDLATGSRFCRDDQADVILAASQPLRESLLRQTTQVERVLLSRPGMVIDDRPGCFDGSDRCTSIVLCGDTRHGEPFQTALRCLADLKEAIGDFECFVLGPHKAERALRKNAAHLPIRDRLTFVKDQPSSLTHGLFETTDILIVPAPGVTADVRILTAMAVGAAVVSVAQPVCDFVIPGQTAILFDEGKRSDLAAKLRDLLSHPDAARDIAHSAQAYLRREHDVETMIEQLLQAYDVN